MGDSDNKLFLKSGHVLSVDLTSCSFNQLANNYWILRGASIGRHINLTYAYVIDYYVTPQKISISGVWRHIIVTKQTALNMTVGLLQRSFMRKFQPAERSKY